MSRTCSRRIIWLALAVVMMGFGIGTYKWLTPIPVATSPFYGTVLDHPRPVSNFDLMTTDGRHFDHQHLHGHWTFIFFGFTHCGSVCPVTMAELGKMYRLIEQNPSLPRPQIVMITLDPKRDDLARMKEYVQAFDPHFLGAQGSIQATQALAREMGIAYTRIQASAKTNNEYSIEHSGAIMLINPNEELVAFFTPPHRAELIVSDYQLLNTR
ncbi:MAG: photosynthetic protein synthase I [Legionella sp.]|nr:MAG: photosynthetic protein synthase I [Legionella sp.]